MENNAMDQVVFDGARSLLDKLATEWAAGAPDGGEPPDPAVRRQIVELLRSRLTSDAPPRHHADDAPAGDAARLHRVSYEYLTRLAHHFSNEDVSFQSPDEIRAFCERIKRSVTIMVKEFSQLLSGRKKFQERVINRRSKTADDDLGVTKMFRDLVIHGDLGRFLFDWRAGERSRENEKALETAIDELKHHQMALLNGFHYSLKEGTRAVLEEISPEAIRRSGGGGFGNLNPFRYRARWNRYSRRFNAILDEDSTWYQDRFLRAFREGYLDYMWRAKSDNEAGSDKPAGGDHGG